MTEKKDAAHPMVTVKEVMSTPVITAPEDETIQNIAKMMEKHHIGSVVIVGSKREPIGIITERDIVIRVVANEASPSKAKVKNTMSSPLHTVGLEEGIDDVAKRMNKLGIRRFAVIDRGKLVGVVSSRDIVSVTPALAWVIAEKARLGITKPLSTKSIDGGFCDECSQWTDVLKPNDGKFYCDDCLLEETEHTE